MNHNGQTLIQKFDLTVDQLEPKYIIQCSDVKLLERILKVLRSGEEGNYPHLESICEERLRSKDPKNRLLRREDKLRTFKDLSNNEQNEIDDIGSWVSEMKNRGSLVMVNKEESGDSSNTDLPPIRSVKKMIGEVVEEEPIVKSTRRAAPKSHQEWDKIISQLDDKENEEMNDTNPNNNETTSTKNKKNRSLTNTINTAGLTDPQKEVLANKEKDKGNEAFRSNDLHEAITYYNRSISVMEAPATYNNRALAYYKMGKWSDAVKDCDRVLRDEHFNLKARLRRAAAYKELRKFRHAQTDLDFVLQEEPHNPRAQEIMKKVEEELSIEEKRKREGKGKIMTIEETDGESSDEEETTPDTNNENNGVTSNHQPVNDETTMKPQVKPTRVEIEESDTDEELHADATESKTDHSKPVIISSIQSEPASVSVDQTEVSEKHKEAEKTAESQKAKCRSSSIYNIIQRDIANNHDKPAEQTTPPAEQTASPAEQTAPPAEHPSPPAQTSNTEIKPETSSQLKTVACGTSTESDQPTTQTTEESTRSGLTEQLSNTQPAVSEPALTEQPSNTQPAVSEPALTEQPSNTQPTVSEQPAVVKVAALADHVDDLKQEGNKLFKNGQYGEAINYYTRAIKHLQSDSTMDYHRGLILSNRAACQLKIGASKSAVEDCNDSLTLIPYNTKSLLRRASAYETLEKYVEAYTDYKQITVLEHSENALAGANRCQTFLTQHHGLKWRSKVPKVSSFTNLTQYELEGSNIATSPNQSTAISPDSEPAKQSEDSLEFKPTVQTTPQLTSPKPTEPVKPVEPVEPVQPSPQEMFSKLKEEGNKYVAKSEYKLAIDKYTSALEYDSDNIAVHSNRAFCYVKTQQPESALKDCNTVLAMENQHIKALYRRGLAYKMLGKYKESLGDLMSVLKLDRNNSAAKKEAESVKENYKRELQSIKNTTAKTTITTTATTTAKPADNKPAETKKTRVLIEETSDDDQKSSSSAQTNHKSKSKSRSKRNKKKQNQTQQPTASTPSTPQVPNLSDNPTPYEFTAAWTSLKGTSDLELYSKLIRQIPPTKIGTVLSNKLEPDMLDKIVISLDKHFNTDELDKVEEYLKSISTVSRFSMITMLMSAQCKTSLENIFKKLNSSKHVDKLRIAYGISK